MVSHVPRPLTPIIPPKFMLWVYGVTGALKSTITALALSHYGEWTEDDLILWSATANALEKYLFLAKDVPFVIDDYAPQTDRYAAQKLEETASRLVRGVGNRSGRARMKGDLSLRTVYRPRGLVISTGEQLPDTQSLVARLVTVETAKGDIHLGKLSEAQDERDRYPHAMAGYIAWLAAQWAHLSAVLPDSWRELRTKARRERQHLRLPESLASLYIGLDLGLTYASELGALSEAAADELRREGWAALVETGERQHKQVEALRPSLYFLTILGELLTQKKAHLLPTSGTGTPGDGDLLGWYDDGNYYLLPSASYHRVAQFARDEGRYMGTKELALRKALAEEGILIAPEGRYTDRIRVGEQRLQVLRLSRQAVEKITGGLPCKSVDIAPKTLSPLSPPFAGRG